MRTIAHFIIGISLVGMMASCQSTEKMLDRGNYDELIRLAQRKLSGKKNKKAKFRVRQDYITFKGGDVQHCVRGWGDEATSQPA